jgi:hypothetical protein
MPKRKKKPVSPALSSNARERYLTENAVMSSIRELAEARTEKQREKIRARIRQYIGL